MTCANADLGVAADRQSGFDQILRYLTFLIGQRGDGLFGNADLSIGDFPRHALNVRLRERCHAAFPLCHRRQWAESVDLLN